MCGNRFTDDDITTYVKVADGGGNVALVLGKEFKSWQRADFSKAQVTLKINNRLKAKGSGAAVMGGPLASLTWLANSLLKENLFLEENQIVCTGTMTGS